MRRAPLPIILLASIAASAQSDWSRIHPNLVGYGAGSYTPGKYTSMARDGADIIVSGKYTDAGFHTSSIYENHYARLRMSSAETTLTLIKKSWWKNATPGYGEHIQDSSINLIDPTPPNRHPIFTVADRYLYQVAGQNYRIKPARSFQPSGVDVFADEIALDGAGSPVTPFTNLDEVTVKSSGSLPGGLAASTVYYLIRVSGTTIKLASSLANARSGTAIDLTSQGTGLDSLVRESDHPSDVWKMNLDTTAGDYATWTQVHPAASTSFLMGQSSNGMAAVWDAHRNKIVVSNLTAAPWGSRRTWTLDLAAPAWTEGSQSAGAGTAPENLSGQQMTFNDRDSTFWLFGAGNISAGGNELWHYRPSTGLWTRLDPASPKPSARAYHCVAYVRGSTAADDMLFVSGGTVGEGGVARRDSWVYRIQSDEWDSLAVTTLPDGGHSTCQWDPNHSRIVMQSDTAWWVYPIGDTTAPAVVAITSPADGHLTNMGTIAVAWSVNGVAQETQTTEVLEVEGENLVIRCSGLSCDTISVFRDQTPPLVEITFPIDGAIVHGNSIDVSWEVDGVPQDTLLTEELELGANLIIRSAADALGNTAHDTVNVTYSLDPPVVVIVSPVQGAELLSSPAAVQWTVDGVAQTTQLTEALAEGGNTIVRHVTYNGGTQSVSASTRVYFDSQPEECLDP